MKRQALQDHQDFALTDPSQTLDGIAKNVVDCCFQVHKDIGPGLLETVEKILPIHEAQIMTYLKLSQKQLGFLINFNTRLIKDGIRRFIV